CSAEQHDEVAGLLQAKTDVLQAPRAQPRDRFPHLVLGGGEPVGKGGELDVKQFPDQFLLVLEVRVDTHRRDSGLAGDGAQGERVDAAKAADQRHRGSQDVLAKPDPLPAWIAAAGARLRALLSDCRRHADPLTLLLYRRIYTTVKQV